MGKLRSARYEMVNCEVFLRDVGNLRGRKCEVTGAVMVSPSAVTLMSIAGVVER